MSVLIRHKRGVGRNICPKSRHEDTAKYVNFFGCAYLTKNYMYEANIKRT